MQGSRCFLSHRLAGLWLDKFSAMFDTTRGENKGYKVQNLLGASLPNLILLKLLFIFTFFVSWRHPGFFARFDSSELQVRWIYPRICSSFLLPSVPAILPAICLSRRRRRTTDMTSPKYCLSVSAAADRFDTEEEEEEEEGKVRPSAECSRNMNLALFIIIHNPFCYSLLTHRTIYGK